MMTTASPGSVTVRRLVKFAWMAPTVTSTLAAVAPGYQAAIASRSSREPLAWG